MEGSLVSISGMVISRLGKGPNKGIACCACSVTHVGA
jgi:hypothetical protein